MGRPLNKKYFGNRNIGTGGNQVGGPLSNSSNYADDKIGGEGIASINWSNYGSWLSVNSGSAPLAGLQLPAPTLPGGVQATWTNYFGASAVTTGAGKTGLILNETYEYAPIPGLIVTVSNLGGANAVFTVTAAGSTTSLLQDLTGVNLTLRTGQGHTGVGTFLVDIKLKIVDTVINEQGSGYTGAETFTVTTANGATGTAPAGTIVLTTDTGNVGSATYQENAILMTARLTGGSATTVDIIRQVSTNRYKVTDGTRTGIVKLKSSVATAAGEGSVRLVDTDGGTYFATKITARKCTIQRGTGVQDAFPNGASVKWNMVAATASSLKIDNA